MIGRLSGTEQGGGVERGVFSDLQVREAIASVTLSHPADCQCDVCKANRGDLLAFVRVCEGCCS